VIRSRPDIHARVLAGEISANAGMIEGGLRACCFLASGSSGSADGVECTDFGIGSLPMEDFAVHPTDCVAG
jgi:hypothetical protein